MSRVVNRWTMALGVTLLLFAPGAASAYVGPGAGLSAIGGALALLVGAILAAAGFVWYPFKRLLRLRRRQSTQDAPASNSR